MGISGTTVYRIVCRRKASAIVIEETNAKKKVFVYFNQTVEATFQVGIFTDTPNVS